MADELNDRNASRRADLLEEIRETEHFMASRDTNVPSDAAPRLAALRAELLRLDGRLACFRHQDRPATRVLRIPCAPGGKLDVCDECYDPANRKPVFEAYFAEHEERVRQQRAAEQIRKIGDN
jgi:hypothetical protein